MGASRAMLWEESHSHARALRVTNVSAFRPCDLCIRVFEVTPWRSFWTILRSHPRAPLRIRAETPISGGERIHNGWACAAFRAARRGKGDSPVAEGRLRENALHLLPVFGFFGNQFCGIAHALTRTRPRWLKERGEAAPSTKLEA